MTLVGTISTRIYYLLLSKGIRGSELKPKGSIERIAVCNLVSVFVQMFGLTMIPRKKAVDLTVYKLIRDCINEQHIRSLVFLNIDI